MYVGCFEHATRNTFLENYIVYDCRFELGIFWLKNKIAVREHKLSWLILKLDWILHASRTFVTSGESWTYIELTTEKVFVTSERPLRWN